LAAVCRWPAELAAWAPRFPVVFVDLKRRPERELAELATFGRVLAVLQAENQPAAAFGLRLRTAVQAVEQLPAEQQALGRRSLWYLHGVLHHRRPPGEHADWRREITESVTRQDLRTEVQAMGQTVAESLIEQGLERGKREPLLHQLQIKFGPVPAELKAWVSGLSDAAALERLAEGVLRADTLEELQAYRSPGQPRKRRRPRTS
jgi:hypothetical protein